MKKIDTGFVLNFHSGAAIQHKKIVVETVQRFFRSTSTCRNMDKALNENESIRLKSQYPENWTSKVINNAFQKP